ncbi:MAG: aminotransferase class III-fold pyridoxal phosphate-dependent enzyme [Gammaproteobacteria bacterium]
MNLRSDNHVAALLAAEFGLSGAIERLDGENDNFRVTDEDGATHVLKLADDSLSSDVIMLECLATEAAIAGNTGIELPRFVRTTSGAIEAVHRTDGGTVLRGRLLEFVGGTPWCESGAVRSGQLRDLGRKLAQLDSCLATIDPPQARRTHRWDLTAVQQHRSKIALVEDRERRRLLEDCYHLYCACALPVLQTLPHSVIHQDLSDENIMVVDGRVSGFLDFGDCLYGPVVCELAVTLAYVLLDETLALKDGAEVVAGCHEVRALSSAELEVLFPLICGRWSNTVCVAAERRGVDPDRDAWYVHEERAWKAIERYASVSPEDARRALEQHIDNTEAHGATFKELVETRAGRISDALSLSYHEPLKIVRGSNQYLYDWKGRPFLDLVNNVCHVGHCHPHVVAAGQKQMAKLNTNTRYLYDGLTDYAQRLCATLPSELEVCFFVNSGSEANELALRLARAHTGRKDLLVVDGAYHGHTTTLTEISPYKFMGSGGTGRAEPWVHVVPMPDGYRGPHKGHGRETGVAYGDEVLRVIERAERPICGFITESFLSCGGQIIPPEGYLETAFAHVHNAGGVCIVDEVQVGFGRAGTHFWAFEQQNVVPDIVVMGKPIGNGHPMAAVVTTLAIADSFADIGMEFFSTFGGNPVSCAIGMAVLDVIENEGLQQHALEVGTRLLDGVRQLMGRQSLIGDVRGTGLFIGIELVRDRETLEPADTEAEQLINGLRQRGVLTSTDGPFHNVIKIKPPMVLTADDVDMFVRCIDDELTH